MISEARRTYLREYNRKWIASRRATFFKDKCCVECNSTDQLELDHIDPATKIHHAIWSWAEPRRLAEIAKCQVLCRACHRVKTNEEITKVFTHGMYGYAHSCRCTICKEANKARVIKGRKSRGGR